MNLLRGALGALLLLGGVACLGPYPNIGEKLDVTARMTGASYISLDAGAARILVLASPDGGPPPPFTRIDESQPRAVETLQGTWTQQGPDLTFSVSTQFSMPDESSKPVTGRRGATRKEYAPPWLIQGTDSVTPGLVVISGPPEIVGTYHDVLQANAAITGTDATATACAFFMANLAVESAEARIPGYNSAGLTQYLNRVEPFDGILSGTVSVGMVGLFNPVTTTSFTNYADFEGVVLDGEQVSTTDSGGTGTLSGILRFRIDRKGLPPLEGSVDYGAVAVKSGNESGNYLVTLDGGTTVQVPTGRRVPPLEQCLGL